MKTTKLLLNHGWRMREIAPEGMPVHNNLPWLPAEVPGSVHLDLIRAGVIPDPLTRLHERDVAWVDDSDWMYETTFTVDALPAAAFLRFNGLDTLAEITLNGKPLGTTENMYIAHEFPVGGKLVAGENHLELTFRSAKRVGAERQAAWDTSGNDTLPHHWDNWNERAFVRKAQYQYGWDWGPVVRGCGLWQPVELITVPVARIGDWQHTVEFTDDGKAVVTITAEVERMPGSEDTPLEFVLKTTGSMVNLLVPTGAGMSAVSGMLIIDNPERWQPNGLGNAPIYYSWLALTTDGKECDHLWSTVGLRTIELVREPDADGLGEGFKFRVNGNDVFIKGANWIPDHVIPALITPNRLRERITQARDAGFNMLRVWGGGFYESDEFYELCDELGILVWQDFPYACSYYPDTGEYAEQAKTEAIAAVKRLRHHASLALWCGNNENLTMYEGNWTKHKPDRFIGDHLYQEILPAVVASENPQTPYWPGSPYGGADANSPDFGDCHNWDVWHGRGDWVHYVENDSRFCSEFGFAASCGLGAWDACLAPADKHPHSPAVRWHDKTRKGYDTYLGLIGIHFPEAQSLEDLVYYSQCNQAEALKCGVEHYRRRKGRNWGTLFWQLNDCWPVQSWAVIDSQGEPRAAYFACKKFYAPVLLSLVREGETATAHLVSDLLIPVSGRLTWTLATLDGETLVEQTSEVSVDANAAASVSSFSLSAATGRERDVYVHAQFTAADGTTVENFLLLAEPKELKTANPALSLTVTESNGNFILTVSAQKFAPYLWLRRADNGPLPNLSDNFFHLRPGETKQLTLPKSTAMQTADDVRGLLVLRSL
ncbi:MAG: beta-mannosidase [Janthinobacterium lividum]